MSIETKLSRLAKTKNQLRNALMDAGAQMEYDEPFGNYANHIPEISQFVETTSTADIMENIDLYEIILGGQYENYSYDETHQQEIMNLCTLILEGEVL